MCLRVDPNSVSEAKQETPMEFAAAHERTEVFKLLKEGTPACKKRKFFIKFISYQGWGSNQFINLAGGRPEVEITDKVKLIQMSLLMKSNRPKTSKNEFQSILETVPVDLVRNGFWKHPKYLPSPGGQHKCCCKWSI